jgi:hypothetical protein
MVQILCLIIHHILEIINSTVYFVCIVGCAIFHTCIKLFIEKSRKNKEKIHFATVKTSLTLNT